jgi:hypothetical protein
MTIRTVVILDNRQPILSHTEQPCCAQVPEDLRLIDSRNAVGAIHAELVHAGIVHKPLYHHLKDHHAAVSISAYGQYLEVHVQSLSGVKNPGPMACSCPGQ